MRAGTANTPTRAPLDGAHRATRCTCILAQDPATQPAGDMSHVASPRAPRRSSKPPGGSWQTQPNGIRSSTSSTSGWGSQASGWSPPRFHFTLKVSQRPSANRQRKKPLRPRCRTWPMADGSGDVNEGARGTPSIQATFYRAPCRPEPPAGTRPHYNGARIARRVRAGAGNHGGYRPLVSGTGLLLSAKWPA